MLQTARKHGRGRTVHISRAEMGELGAEWIYRTRPNHTIWKYVITGMRGVGEFTPDIYGISGTSSLYVRIVATRGDFVRLLREHGDGGFRYGYGSYRYFMSPKGVVCGDAPSGWGVVEYDEGGSAFSIVRESEEFDNNYRMDMMTVCSFMAGIGIKSRVYCVGGGDRSSGDAEK